MTSNITFVDIILHINGGKGHVLPYHKAVSKAVQVNKWTYVPLVSKSDKMPLLPDDWNINFINSGVLDYERQAVLSLFKKLNIWVFIKSTYTLYHDMKKQLRRVVIKDKAIVMLESFNPLQLIAVFLSLSVLPKNKFEFWLIYRGSHKWGGRKHFIMSITFSIFNLLVNYVFDKRYNKNNLLLLTDSEVLCESLPKFYRRNVYLLPIPHTPDYSNRRNDNKVIKNCISCWWPGAPREEKGLEIIKKLSRSNVGSSINKLELIVAQSAQIASNLNSGIRIKHVEDILSQEDYDNYFVISDFILLPYDKDIYAESTSGIFIECIFSGAIPLVTQNTWMHYELKKWELGFLAINWEDDIVNIILSMYEDSSIKEKMKLMQDYYVDFHSVSSFAKKIDLLSDGSNL